MQRGVHPDVVEFAPGGASYRVKEDVRDTILPEAARAPIEAERRVLILFEAERLRGNQNESANAMLKTIEEPPPRTIVVLVTAAPDDLLPTIRSRCQRIDFDPVADDALQAALERDGDRRRGRGDRGRALRRAAGAGPGAGRPARADAGRVRATRRPGSTEPARPRSRWPRRSAPRSTRPPTRSRAATTKSCASSTPSWSDSATRTATLACSGAASSERQQREARRTRIDLLLEGVTVIESVYRDALADPAPPLNRDRPRLVVSPRAAATALDVCRQAREAFLINEKGLVRLTHLLLSLPIEPGPAVEVRFCMLSAPSPE